MYPLGKARVFRDNISRPKSRAPIAGQELPGLAVINGYHENKIWGMSVLCLIHHDCIPHEIAFGIPGTRCLFETPWIRRHSGKKKGPLRGGG